MEKIADSVRQRATRNARRMKRLVAHLRRVGDDERLRSAAVSYGRLDYPGAEIHLRLSSRDEFHRLSSCEKEPWTVRWIEQHLGPGEVLYDVGANVGAYTLLAAVVADARVVAFEPGPANFAALAANVELNAVGERVLAVPMALGDTPHSALLDRDAAVPGKAPRLGQIAADKTTTVLVDRLDDMIDRFSLPPPDHLKLDVDGAELEVLAGSQRLLGSGRLRTLMVELELEREVELRALIEGSGFELVERATGRSRHPAAPAYGLFAAA